MIFYEDKKYSFWEMFNENNGTLIRSDVKGTKMDPYMRSFPELIDIGVMGHCISGEKGLCKMAGIDCYQKGDETFHENMSLDDYKRIIDEASGKTFQVALGGAGDPNKHENFREMLCYTRLKGIVPNLTTSGYGLTEEETNLIGTYCGAVAVSFYSRLLGERESNEITINAIKMFQGKITTNIHYVISRDSISEAIYRLENEMWPEGINAIIFLLYKPVGHGVKEKAILPRDALERFIDAALSKKHKYAVGFDTCFTPVLFDYMNYIEINSIDSCEAARFSMYIDSMLNAYPCSFDNQKKQYCVSMRDKTIAEVWNSDIFKRFRSVRCRASNCLHEGVCYGGCGLELGINNGRSCRGR